MERKKIEVQNFTNLSLAGLKTLNILLYVFDNTEDFGV
jgi:hypothetical protein